MQVVTVPPATSEHDGILVVRDDLFEGGTKARFIPALFANADEVVYASPAEGGAQTALAHVAMALGKRATIFVAKRTEPHRRTLLAREWGAKVVLVEPGYLNVVKARARAYCAATGATEAPFGMDTPGAIDAIAAAAMALNVQPAEVWCAAGSGVLARALGKAWPQARRHAVQVGRKLTPAEVGGAEIHSVGLPFSRSARTSPPFPADQYYEAKAWEVAKARRGAGLVLFWSVTGPA